MTMQWWEPHRSACLPGLNAQCSFLLFVCIHNPSSVLLTLHSASAHARVRRRYHFYDNAVVVQWLPLQLAVAATQKLQRLLVMAFPCTQGQVHVLVAFNRQLNKLVLLDTVQGSLEVRSAVK